MAGLHEGTDETCRREESAHNLRFVENILIRLEGNGKISQSAVLQGMTWRESSEKYVGWRGTDSDVAFDFCQRRKRLRQFSVLEGGLKGDTHLARAHYKNCHYGRYGLRVYE